jgi:DNA-binding NarL/FixJ family response regulator
MSNLRSSGPPRQRIFIVDDHPMTRYGIAQLLKQEREFEVCGEADTAHRALAAIKALKPNLVLADLTMPGKDGLEFVKDMRAMHPHVAVLVVSMHDEALYAERVLRAGGRGYVMKHAGGKELLQAIRRVLDGHVYVSEAMAERALDAFSGQRSQTADSVIGQLTDRELQVFQCLGQGMTSREIGERLHMSVKTVETHRRHVRENLKLKTGPELIRFAVRWVSSQ